MRDIHDLATEYMNRFEHQAIATAKERLVEREEAKAAQARAEDEVRELRWKLKEAESKQSSGPSKSAANGKEYADLQKERDMLFVSRTGNFSRCKRSLIHLAELGYPPLLSLRSSFQGEDYLEVSS